jgi:hypothetical protein
MPAIAQMLNIATARDNKRREICSAIRQLRTLEFYYHGGYHTVEPYCLGIVKKGEADNESLICYQTSGFSDLGEVVGWKLYRASEMEDIEPLRQRFAGTRPGFDPDNLEMYRVICYARPAWGIEEDIKEPVAVPQKRSLTHNEIMARFRYVHPWAVTELDITLWPELMMQPLLERVESLIQPAPPVLEDTSRYLVGQTA